MMSRLVPSAIRVVFCLLWSLSHTSAIGDEPNVHVVIISDTSPAAHWGRHAVHLTMDTTLMFSTVMQHLPDDRLRVYPLSLEADDWSTPDNVLKQIADVSLQPQDTLVVYFTGHGAADDQGHYLQLAKGKLHRSDLRQAMQQRGARLNVLLTDCCNVRGDGQGYFAPNIGGDSPKSPTPLFESLFLKSSGWVDINSSSPGQGAFFRNIPEGEPIGFEPDQMPGSLFTIALTDFFRKRRELPLSWDDLVRECSIDVHLLFQKNYPQGAAPAKGQPIQSVQNVYAFEYPGKPQNSGPRTGLLVRDFRQSGALITNVQPESPAAHAFDVSGKRYTSLQPGQLIVEANGTPIRSAADLMAAVRESPPLLRLRVADEDQRQNAEYLMQLRY